MTRHARWSPGPWIAASVLLLSIGQRGMKSAPDRRGVVFALMTAAIVPLMVFGFGLLHGFGLSTRLQQRPQNASNCSRKCITPPSLSATAPISSPVERSKD